MVNDQCKKKNLTHIGNNNYNNNKRKKMKEKNGGGGAGAWEAIQHYSFFL